MLIATPTLDGCFCGAYVGGLMNSVRVLSQAGVGVDWVYFSHAPVLSTVRAQIVPRFLDSGASHLLCVDADQGWRGEDVLRLLSHNAPFVTAAYARWQGAAFDVAETCTRTWSGAWPASARGAWASRSFVGTCSRAWPRRTRSGACKDRTSGISSRSRRGVATLR